MKHLFKLITTVILLCSASAICNDAELTRHDSLTIAMHDSIFSSVNMRSEEGLLKTRATLERLLNISENSWLIHHYIGLTDINLAIMNFGAVDEK